MGKSSRRTPQERIDAKLRRSQAENDLRAAAAERARAWQEKYLAGKSSRRPNGYSWATATAVEILEDMKFAAGRPAPRH